MLDFWSANDPYLTDSFMRIHDLFRKEVGKGCYALQRIQRGQAEEGVQLIHFRIHILMQFTCIRIYSYTFGATI